MTRTLDDLIKDRDEDDYRVFDSAEDASRWMFNESESDLFYLFHLTTQLDVGPDTVIDKKMKLSEYILRQLDQFYFLDDGRVVIIMG